MTERGGTKQGTPKTHPAFFLKTTESKRRMSYS